MIELMPGNALILRAYPMVGVRREVARRHLRRKYAEGVQYAFCYYEEHRMYAAQLRRLQAWLDREREEDEDS